MGQMAEVVSLPGVTCRRADRDGLRMMSSQRGPSLDGHPQDDCLEGTRSRSVKLVDAVLQLQKDMEEFRAESGYGGAGRQATPVQTPGRSKLTSAPVSRYAGRSSREVQLGPVSSCF